MKVKILTDGCFSTAIEAVGQIVEATAAGAGVTVTAKELKRVGCTEAFGDDYPYFPTEFEVVKDES